jgi:hypothetical protein
MAGKRGACVSPFLRFLFWLAPDSCMKGRFQFVWWWEMERDTRRWELRMH